MDITSGTEGLVNLTAFVVLSVYFLATSALMLTRRHVAPVKGHSCVLIVVSGVGGYAAAGVNFNIFNYIGNTNFPCPLYFWSFMAIVPLYCFPYFLICLDLYNKYIMGETLVLLGQEKAKAISNAPNNLAEVTKKLKSIKLYNSPAAQAIKMVAMFIPTTAFALVVFSVDGDDYWSTSHFDCDISNTELLSYVCLAIVYIALSIAMVIKLKNVQDAFGIKEEIIWVFLVQLGLLVLYVPSFLIAPLSDALSGAGCDPGWLIVFMMATTHFIACVRPTLESYGIHVSRFTKLPNVTENEVTLTMVLSTPEGVRIFAQHLIREFSAENIEFWKEVNAYRAAGLIDPNTCNTRADYLMENFINPQSTNWVNLPDSVRSAVTAAVKSGKATPTTFDNAQKEILILMDRDSFPRFKKGDLFKKFISTPHIMSHMRVVKSASDHYQGHPESGASSKASNKGRSVKASSSIINTITTGDFLQQVSVLMPSHREDDSCMPTLVKMLDATFVTDGNRINEVWENGAGGTTGIGMVRRDDPVGTAAEDLMGQQNGQNTL